MQTKWLIVSQLGDSVSFSVNYGEEEAPKVEEEKSLLDNIKGFFSDGETEDIRTVEANTMQTLVDELETAVETISEEGVDDLCEPDSPISSLDCSDDGRLEKLQRLQSEVARLKQLHQQLTNGGAVSTDTTDPGSRLHEMEAELTRLKQFQAETDPIEQAPELVNADQNDNILLDQAEETFNQEQSKIAEEEELRRSEEAAVEKARQKGAVIEAKLTPLKDKATGVSFDPKLEYGLYLVGVGVRKKAIINVYAVGMYSSPLSLGFIVLCSWKAKERGTISFEECGTNVWTVFSQNNIRLGDDIQG